MTILKMSAEDYTISAEYLALMLEFLDRRGIGEERALEGLPIEPGCWRDPKARLTAAVFDRFARRALALTGEPWMGWELGASMTLSSHGFLGYAAMSSETLGDAIELAVKFFRTRSTIIQLESFADGDWAVLQVNEMLALGDLAPLVVESLFSSFHFMAMQLIPDVEILGELRFSYPEPAYFARLRPLIPVPVYFDCAYSQMRFPVERLQRRLRFADPRLAQMAAAQCEQEMERIKAPPALLGQVRRIMLAGSGGFPGVDDVASELHMSSRTLKRKLQQLGTSYQTLLDDLRKGLAVEYLTQSHRSVDEIALALGYSDASNFARAFRRWTGRSPSDYR
ncbi:AraC family transcriptional regulator [Alcanivorax sp. 521-1]|uniref:AraC family transcriptional regulator n=1 Tax=Alloalcanivorax profundimaris TaxID=2735259 RepID=A0ABS0AN90_9GAMM|nr:AraC family transcriptional regulator [Alloalcanivorax profundimaris]MAO60952.1 AraC family transcriptional regulator [Alcanivorax sp.]MBM1145513.1 AraC family transcriptional regulator [Alcanivorax sp. ZXX171]MAY09648.1 AraC family transcriptional regulator [Alcanivorax sp.]MBF5055603.1 AraC family transcriptional regulator [Alloalcanivorax profundimaris]HCE41522.1 AraC family transcriptional regulator [Alcanivorax sp.]|tara:strand:+ start:49822 stop:50835 length:1014 start_codon:yes stop_codon:yes gene_type:complete